jgi:hypothetical protein
MASDYKPALKRPWELDTDEIGQTSTKKLKGECDLPKASDFLQFNPINSEDQPMGMDQDSAIATTHLKETQAPTVSDFTQFPQSSSEAQETEMEIDTQPAPSKDESTLQAASNISQASQEGPITPPWRPMQIEAEYPSGNSSPENGLVIATYPRGPLGMDLGPALPRRPLNRPRPGPNLTIQQMGQRYNAEEMDDLAAFAGRYPARLVQQLFR